MGPTACMDFWKREKFLAPAEIRTPDHQPVYKKRSITVHTQLYLLGAFAKFRKAAITFVISACPSLCPSARNNSAPSRRIFKKFDVSSIFRLSVQKIHVSLKSDKNNGFCFLDRTFSIMKTKINQRNAQINSG